MELLPLKTKPGQALVELMLAMALTSILLPALLTGLVASREGRAQLSQRVQATFLLVEAREAIRSVRERGWTALATNGTFHPIISSSIWTLVSGPETISGYTRSIVISDYFRNGTPDPSTKEVVVTVSWNTPLPSQVKSTLYLTRHLDNLTYIQTTQSEFDTGIKTSVVTTNTSGGEIVLASGGQGNWCEPDLTITALDLPKNGVANALTAIAGQAFTGTGENASGVSFANVTISNTNPPVASNAGTYDGFKTNDIFGETNYAYLATDNNSKEIEIINLTTNPYSEAGFFDSPGPTNADSIFVSGNVGYMTAGSLFYTFDLSSKSGSRPQLGSIALAGTGTEVVVIGTYAYVSLANSVLELQIIDISNPSQPIIVGTADASTSTLGGQDVYVNSTATRAYLVSATSLTDKEFFIIDISTKTGLRPIVGSYELGGTSPKGVTVVPGNRAIVVGNGGEEYQVIDISNESAPVRCGGLNIDSGVNGIDSVLEADGDAYSYIITGDSGSEFKIIEGGPGGQYAASGTFESATFNPGFQTAFNYLDFTATTPNQTSITLQVAISPNCSTFNYVGPDGTSNTFFTVDSAIPFSANPGNCFRYKVYFSTSDSNSTPIFSDITINYSP